MVLVDTSVWVSHLREGEALLERLLHAGEVICHPFIVGELACGNLKNRSEILTLLRSLPMAIVADHEELLYFIESHRLMEKGVSYVDVHLLASAVLTGVSLWTFDQPLKKVAQKLGIHWR
jgi:predicted nucleic acid-binding protein